MADEMTPDPRNLDLERLFKGIPIENPFWLSREAALARARLGKLASKVSRIEVFSNYPRTEPNAPFYSSTGEEAFCLIRFPLDDSSYKAYQQAAHRQRVRLTLRAYSYPTYPLVQFVVRIHPLEFAEPWWQEIIGNITDGDIQKFIYDACRNNRWTLILARYDPIREEHTNQMTGCLEVPFAMSDNEVEDFLQQTKAAVEHYHKISGGQLDFSKAATDFINDNLPIEINL